MILTIYHKYTIICLGSNGVAYNKTDASLSVHELLIRYIFWRHIRDYFANHKETHKNHNNIKHAITSFIGAVCYCETHFWSDLYVAGNNVGADRPCNKQE